MSLKRILIVGGTSGIGLAIAQELLGRGAEQIYLLGKEPPCLHEIDASLRDKFQKHTTYVYVNLAEENYAFFERHQDVDALIITAGFGRVAPFESLTSKEIENLIKVNELAAIQIIHRYYAKINSENPFYCAIMGSIAGHVASPLFSVYGASKFGVCSFIENINIELEMNGCQNRILDISPGVIKGTRFSHTSNDLLQLMPLASEIVERMLKRERLYIPNYEEIYKDVIDRYRNDVEAYGRESYAYKKSQGRINGKPQIIVGYLSGTFDLFHIGHLNLLKRAKEKCDYLIVGVHKSGAWKNKETYIPFEERVEILRSNKYVDEVVESCREDSDAWNLYKYNKLFVGSDYKGSERFAKYEKFFEDKDVEIVYFPYTQGTSSTQLRGAIEKGLTKK